MLDQTEHIRTISELLERSLDGLLPPVRMSLPDFAEEYIYVNNAVTAGRQKFNLDTAPYQREIMDTLGDPLYQYVNVVAPSRAGKTYLSLILSAYTVMTNPRDFLFVHPNHGRALKFADKDLRRFFEDNPDYKDLIQPGRTTNRRLVQQFLNGSVHTHTWPSSQNLSGSDEAVIALPDYDRADDDIGGEGSLKEQADARTKLFGFDKTVFTESSPSKNPDEFSRFDPATPHEAPRYPGILALYNEGDRRQWYWQCVSCRKAFPAHPDHLHYEQDPEMDIQLRAASARMVCPHCQQDYAHNRVVGSGLPGKYELNKAGLWVPDGMKVSEYRELEGEMLRPPVPGQMNTASFWLFGPAAAFQSWPELVRKRLNAEKVYEDTGKDDTLKTVINTDFGLPWIPPHIAEAKDWETLWERAFDYAKGVVPPGALYLLTTVDVQKFRWEIQTHAFGPQGRMWIIDRQQVKFSDREWTNKNGKPERAYVRPGEHAEDWDLLTAKLKSLAYPLHDGSGVMVPMLIGCDSNGHGATTAHAYDWWRGLKDPALPRSRVLLIKGDDSLKPLTEIKNPDGRKRNSRNAGGRGDVPVLFISSNQMKNILAANLDRQVDGPGFISLPGWAEPSWFKEMTNERRKGDKWVKVSDNAPNESWDLCEYAIALNMSDKVRAHLVDWSSDRLPPYALPAAQNPFVSPVSVASDGSKVVGPAPKMGKPYLTREQIGQRFRELGGGHSGYS